MINQQKETAPYTFLNNMVHVSIEARVTYKSLPQLPLLQKLHERKTAVCLQSDMKS